MRVEKGQKQGREAAGGGGVGRARRKGRGRQGSISCQTQAGHTRKAQSDMAL